MGSVLSMIIIMAVVPLQKLQPPAIGVTKLLSYLGIGV